MVSISNVIEVPVPEGTRAAPEDLELLESLFRAIAGLHFESGNEWPWIRQALERNGWSVRWGLQWHVEARRGRELEEACGPTVDEAFARVWQVAREDTPLEGTP